MSRLDELEQQGRWRDVVTELRRLIDAESDPQRRVTLLERLMDVHFDRFGARVRAARVAKELLELDPEHLRAREVLAPVADDLEAGPRAHRDAGADVDDADDDVRDAGADVDDADDDVRDGVADVDDADDDLVPEGDERAGGADRAPDNDDDDDDDADGKRRADARRRSGGHASQGRSRPRSSRRRWTVILVAAAALLVVSVLMHRAGQPRELGVIVFDAEIVRLDVLGEQYGLTVGQRCELSITATEAPSDWTTVLRCGDRVLRERGVFNVYETTVEGQHYYRVVGTHIVIGESRRIRRWPFVIDSHQGRLAYFAEWADREKPPSAGGAWEVEVRVPVCSRPRVGERLFWGAPHLPLSGVGYFVEPRALVKYERQYRGVTCPGAQALQDLPPDLQVTGALPSPRKSYR